MSQSTVARAIASNPELAQKANEQFEALMSRSATDSEFRKKLLTDSSAAIAEFTGNAPNTATKIVFIENTADATIVLPDPIDPTAELSEGELEAVAGGATPLLATLAAAAASALTGQLIGQAIHEFTH